MSPGNPPPRRSGNLRVATREWGPGGSKGANRANQANRANPPPSDPAPACQVTFQVTYGVRWGANRANRRGGGTRHRGGVATGHTPTPPHSRTTFRAGGGGEGLGLGGGRGAAKKGGGRLHTLTNMA